MPRKNSRRLTADDPRYAQLPIVAVNDGGELIVLRGQFTPTPAFTSSLAWLSASPNTPHLVFSSRRGDLTVLPVGSFITDVNDPSASSSWHLPSAEGCSSLAQLAQRLLDAAADITAIAADGWVLDEANFADVTLRDERA